MSLTNLKLLLLFPSDQTNNELSRYLDLKCHYDFGNYIFGLRRLCKNLEIFDYSKSFVEKGPFLMEKEILDIIQKDEIDFVLIPNLYFEISIRLLHSLRNRNVKSLLVFYDDSSRFSYVTANYLGYSDYYISTESKEVLEYYGAYKNLAFFIPAFPSHEYLKSFDSDIIKKELVEACFVGSNISDRSDFISLLQSNGVSVLVHGNGWPLGKVDQSEMISIFKNSSISLNFTKNNSKEGSKQLKARSFEIVLSGGFLLTEEEDQIKRYFKVGEQIDTFNDIEDCLEKVRFYLGNPEIREKMRTRAFSECKANYTFEKVWGDFFLEIESFKVQKAVRSTKKLPFKALKFFIKWHLKFIIGRFYCGQYRLAFEHIIWFTTNLFTKLLNNIIPQIR